MEAVGEEVGAVGEGGGDVDERGAGLGGDGTDGGVHFLADGAVGLGLAVFGGNGSEGAEEDARVRGEGLEAADDFAEIGWELMAEGGEGEVVDAEHEDDGAWGGREGVAGGGSIEPGAEGDAEGGGAVDAVVCGKVAATGEAGEGGGIGKPVAVGDLVAVGDAVAGAGDADGGGRGGGA